MKPKECSIGIVVENTAIHRYLVVLIAIMTFLACLMLGGTNLIFDASKKWCDQVSTEATVVVEPETEFFNQSFKPFNIEKKLLEVCQYIEKIQGVVSARIIDAQQTKKLLSPWITNIENLKDLPIPRMIVLKVDSKKLPNYEQLSLLLTQKFKNVRLDTHKVWIRQFRVMANTVVYLGGVFLVLIFIVSMISIVFATRSALSVNRHTVEVLHFLGAEAQLIAQQFNHYFFWSSFKGALIGGSLSCFFFIFLQFLLIGHEWTLEHAQLSMFFGNFWIKSYVYLEFFLLILFVAWVSKITCNRTILHQLHKMNCFVS